MRSQRNAFGTTTISAQNPANQRSGMRLLPRMAQRIKSGEMLLNTISSRAALSPSLCVFAADGGIR